MREIFIVNPKAGMDDRRIVDNNIRKYYPDAVIKYTSAAGQIPDMIRAHEGEKVFLVGGDGTFYEAANGGCCGKFWQRKYRKQKEVSVVGAAEFAEKAADETTDSETDDDISLCFIPAGSGNDFVRTLYIDEAIEVIRTAYWKVLDVSRKFIAKRFDCGKETGNGDKFFLNIGSVGFDAEIVKNSERYKRIPILKKISYILSVFYTVFRFKGIDLNVKIDGKDYSGKKLLVAVANGQYYGGGIRIAPKADMTDGLFDVILIDMMKPIKTFVLLPSLITGAHLKCAAVSLIRAKRVEIESTKETLLNLDGELFKQSKFVFEMCEKGLKTLVPNV